MTARENLLALYAHWRRLTEAEAEAMRGAAWNQVAEGQEAKAELQTRILAATEAAQLESSGLPVQQAAEERQLRAVINALIGLEKNNLELLAARRAEAERERQHLDQTGQTLRRLHRSYVPAGPSAHWQSYS
jgi:hypothetical protein